MAPHYGEDQISLGTTCLGKDWKGHFIWEYDMESNGEDHYLLGTTCYLWKALGTEKMGNMITSLWGRPFHWEQKKWGI